MRGLIADPINPDRSQQIHNLDATLDRASGHLKDQRSIGSGAVWIQAHRSLGYTRILAPTPPVPMTTTAPPRHYTPAQYFALEQTAEHRSEYHHGAIIPMTGGTLNHNRIAGNLFALLKAALRGTGASAFIGDLRVSIPSHDRYTYPDVLMIQGDPQFLDDRTDTILNPSVIIEVLSKSTQNYDRGDKFLAYRSIPSLQEYILIDQYQIHLEQLSKLDDRNWNLRTYTAPEPTLTFTSLDLAIAIADLYEDVTFPAP